MQTSSSNSSPPGVGRMSYGGLLVGVYAGALFSILSFALYASVSTSFVFGTRHAIHSHGYTLAIYCLLGGVIGLVFGALVWIASRILPFIRRRALWVLLVFPFATLLPFVFVNARWQIAQPRNVGIFDEYRVAFVQRSLLVCVLAGLLVSLLLVFWLYRYNLLVRARKFHAACLGAILMISAGTLADMHLFHSRIDWEAIEHVSQCEPGDQQVLLIGLDGATWTVLQPLIDQGRLPHLKRFKDESAFGTLQVFGKAYSPAVWTTVVTGVKRSRHGILTHTVVGPEGVVRSGSTHRKVPAVWNIVNQTGHKVGMINYMASFPPEPVLGINFPNVTPIGSTPYDKMIWPKELIPEVSRLVESVPPVAGIDEHVATLNHELEVLIRLFERFWDPSYSFFTWYTHSTDDIEHRYWNYMSPERFRGTPLEPTPEAAREKGEAICHHWEKVDALFEYINSVTNENTIVIVVSDHGMEAASTPEVHLSLNKLLAKMGLAALREDAEIDESKTIAYWPTGSDHNLPATGIRINRAATHSFMDGARSYEEVRDHVIDRLRQIRLEKSGRPLFPAVYRSEEAPDPAYKDLLSESDIAVYLSAHTRGADLEESLDVDGVSVPLRDVLKIKGDVSGGHHPRGIIMAKGPPFSQGPAFCRPTVETPVSDVLSRALGRDQRLNGIMGVAQFLGIVDRATTLDIAQTTLYLLGLPVAEYMQGRVLVEGLERDYVDDRTGFLIADYGIVPAERTIEELPASNEELERLRSLGYVD